MIVELEAGDVEILLTSLGHSLDRIRNAEATPREIRKESLRRIETVREKLQSARDQSAPQGE